MQHGTTPAAGALTLQHVSMTTGRKIHKHTHTCCDTLSPRVWKSHDALHWRRLMEKKGGRRTDRKNKFQKNKFHMRLGSSSHFLFVFPARASDWLVSLRIIVPSFHFLFFFYYCYSFLFVIPESSTGTETWLAAAEWLTVGAIWKLTNDGGEEKKIKIKNERCSFPSEAVVTNGRGIALMLLFFFCFVFLRMM